MYIITFYRQGRPYQELISAELADLIDEIAGTERQGWYTITEATG